MIELIGLGSSVLLLAVMIYDGRQHRKILRAMEERDQ